ncbi:hypothetical protein COL40_11665 [Bacillus toyonensis]|uniref:ABC-three component system middle component 7 n=1 Tax=Bacillus cereus group TaxID=86661 RepID=UPI000BF96835|nr:ABC-three component system middle component 7 [Bacillus toyonensis]MCM0004266.1 hypothetical protein [Bacillus paranthracis]PFX88126.1 hypothetical protein COL40_11665 [Bacillus toyonensis]HDR7914780.1 hypothetical protein [Bacillus wiedmannii]
MIVPNKVIRFNESIMGKMIILLKELSVKDMRVEELYVNNQEHFDEIDEFIIALDVLYILEAIQVDFDKGEVKYVKRD